MIPELRIAQPNLFNKELDNYLANEESRSVLCIYNQDTMQLGRVAWGFLEEQRHF